jgi:sugar phosphate isomerase/epimerase
VRIQLTVEGGIAYFPGLSQPTTIDTDHIDGKDAEELKRLVEAARFFDRPKVVGAPKRGARDYQQYTLTVEEHGRRHTIRLTDPVEDPALESLLNKVRQEAKALRAADRGRPPSPPSDKPSP